MWWRSPGLGAAHQVADRFHAADQSFPKPSVTELWRDNEVDDALRVFGANHGPEAAADLDVDRAVVHRHEHQHAVVVAVLADADVIEVGARESGDVVRATHHERRDLRTGL